MAAQSLVAARTCADLEAQSKGTTELSLCAEKTKKQCGSAPVLELIPDATFRELVAHDFKGRCEWVRKNLCGCYTVKEVYRPTMPAPGAMSDADRLVEVNPHRRKDIVLNAGHQFEFYVLRPVVAATPAFPLGSSREAAEAMALKLDNIPLRKLCASSQQHVSAASGPAAEARLVAQWPDASQPRLTGAPTKAFNATAQPVVLWFDCAPSTPSPPPPIATQCPPDKQCPIEARPASTVAMAVLGAGAALLAARAWTQRSAGSAPVRNAPDPGPRLPPTRVHADPRLSQSRSGEARDE